MAPKSNPNWKLIWHNINMKKILSTLSFWIVCLCFYFERWKQDEKNKIKCYQTDLYVWERLRVENVLIHVSQSGWVVDKRCKFTLFKRNENELFHEEDLMM